MPFQNRVDPFGALTATPARGTLMGNRGILHDDQREIRKTHQHQHWVTCALSFKDIRRQLMSPRRYTELFFLDEATSFAAGHRPCYTCRRARYQAFLTAWQDAHGGAEEGRTLPHTIDRAVHRARIHRRQKVTFDAPLADLPDGTIVTDGDAPLLIRDGGLHRWSFDGYTLFETPLTGTVTVLTPEPLIEVFRAGYRPDVHESLGTHAS
ncbi:hypothetical protein [Mameliella sediminis]|uniref:hypothetical protein n=1 Tax=Mameliella sediminis TaxID=2836866 RepID=UPI001C464722|nr:hypothetical protein [Mameliella sediminis]MBV7394112.1 hypothetical protein [Mameliella sediminis]